MPDAEGMVVLENEANNKRTDTGCPIQASGPYKDQDIGVRRANRARIGGGKAFLPFSATADSALFKSTFRTSHPADGFAGIMVEEGLH